MDAVTLTVTVKRIIFPVGGAESETVIARVFVAGGGEAVIAGPSGLAPPIECGLRVELIGQWVEHKKYGRQFAFAAYTAAPVQDRKAVVVYLTGLAPAMTDGMALKLYAAYGAKAVETLREQPATVATAGILTPELAFGASTILLREKRYEATKIELITMLGGKGFQLGALIPWCLDAWGAKAPDVIRRNPFTLLLRGAPSCGWHRADALYTSLGHDPKRLKRQALAAVYVVQESRGGHTWHDVKVVAKKVTEFIGSAATPGRALKLAIRSRLLAVWRESDRRYVALAEAARHESELAANLREVSRWTGRTTSRGKPGSGETPSPPSSGATSEATPTSAA